MAAQARFAKPSPLKRWGLLQKTIRLKRLISFITGRIACRVTLETHAACHPPDRRIGL